MITDETRLMTVAEVAQFLRVGRATVYRRIHEGTIPAIRLGDEQTAPLRIDARELERAFTRPGARADHREGDPR